MNSGYEVIKEMAKQGLRGSFFSKSQYKNLAKTKDFSEVKEKIAVWGYLDVQKAKNISDIINSIKKSQSMTDSNKGCITALVLEPLFWLLLALTSC